MKYVIAIFLMSLSSQAQETMVEAINCGDGGVTAIELESKLVGIYGSEESALLELAQSFLKRGDFANLEDKVAVRFKSAKTTSVIEENDVVCVILQGVVAESHVIGRNPSR